MTDGNGDSNAGMSASTTRTVLVDASVLITLADVGRFDLLQTLRGQVTVPETVADEVMTNPAASRLSTARDAGWVHVCGAPSDTVERATTQLGESHERNHERPQSGDVALVAWALGDDDVIVVSDDRPLRETCKSLSIPVSGSLGVLIHAVEQGALNSDDAVETLYAMDEVGARLSASLVRDVRRRIEDRE